MDNKWKIFRRKVSSSAAHPILELPSEIPKEAIPEAKINKTEQIDVSQLAQRILLDTCVPPAVLINKKGEILYFHGRTGKYLEPAPGEARLDIVEMAHKGLKLELVIPHLQVDRY